MEQDPLLEDLGAAKERDLSDSEKSGEAEMGDNSDSSSVQSI